MIVSGNVGIGITSPAAKLDIEGSGGVILNAGNVGIGTTAPGSRLEVTHTNAGALTYPLLLTNAAGSNNGSGVGINFDNFDAGGTTVTGRIENV